MNQKIIIFKVPEFPHLSETFIVAQIVTAIKLGYEIKILVRRRLSDTLALDNSLIKQYQLLDKIIIEDYKIPKNKYIRIYNWIKLLILNLRNLKYILKFYKEYSQFSLTYLYQWHFYKQFNSASIIHVQYGSNKHPFDLLKKTAYFKPKLIVTFHGHDAVFPINGFIPNDGYYDNLFKYADLITSNTPYLANKILALGCPKEKMEIIPVGVDTDFFYNKKIQNYNNDDIKLISVGRLSVVKGHINALKVVKKLKEHNYNIILTIVGEGSERTNLENYINANNLENSIRLVGAKSQEKVRDLLWENDIFIFPSVSMHFGYSAETQGLATIEAESCGLPVVAFDSGGVKYTFEDGFSGFLCKEYDIECMFNKLKLLIDNRKLLLEMGTNATNFVNSKYSQKIIDNKWKKIYHKLNDE
ncbi:MAG: glycosyltransferase [Bacteroidetes bacterium]|nr:glycosyltransferase [Bacteroidota bacterium]